MINFIYRRRIYTTSLKIILIFLICYLLISVLRIWYGDTVFALGQRANEAGNPGKAYNYLTDAVSINPNEPFYHSELSFAAGSAALVLQETDATLSAHLKDEAIRETDLVLKENPKNTSFYRTAIRTYYEIAGIDPKYTQKTLDTIDKTILLAPTDPKLYYNKAVILGQNEKIPEAIEALNKAIELKSNYREGYFALSLFLFDQKKMLDAVQTMRKVLELVPNDPDALKQLNDWGKAGVATQSAKP